MHAVSVHDLLYMIAMGHEPVKIRLERDSDAIRQVFKGVTTYQATHGGE